MSHDLSPLGFRKTPFTRELTVRERFPLDPQAQVAAALTEAVQERMSAALIAPAGTGKTVALRMLVAALPEKRFQVHYVKVTGLSKRDLCKEIAVACGLSPTGIYPALVCASCSAPRPRPCLPLVPPPRPRSGTPRSAGRHCRPVTPRYRTRPTRSRPDRATDPPGTAAVGPPGPTSFSRRKTALQTSLLCSPFCAPSTAAINSLWFLVHHMAKRSRRNLGQSLRGSSDLHAWTDSACYLVRRPDDRLQLTVEHRSAPRSRPASAAPLRRRRPASLAARRQRCRPAAPAPRGGPRRSPQRRPAALQDRPAPTPARQQRSSRVSPSKLSNNAASPSAAPTAGTCRHDPHPRLPTRSHPAAVPLFHRSAPGTHSERNDHRHTPRHLSCNQPRPGARNATSVGSRRSERGHRHRRGASGRRRRLAGAVRYRRRLPRPAWARPEPSWRGGPHDAGVPWCEEFGHAWNGSAVRPPPPLATCTLIHRSCRSVTVARYITPHT